MFWSNLPNKTSVLRHKVPERRIQTANTNEEFWKIVTNSQYVRRRWKINELQYRVMVLYSATRQVGITVGTNEAVESNQSEDFWQ